ncbi:polysaccharide deacetylase family protein [Halobacterium yunchengense]|uniref:polysaccharide deacetylase family protein n=1 Tax=Halobacterium yunchengense TaxID=3108497 RepID=UPI00300A33CB
MWTPDELLLTGWRALAFVGDYTGVAAMAPEETNRVLRYHSVGGGFYDDISPGYFREQLDYLTDAYEVVDLPGVLERGDEKRVALTFDDGYRDFYEYVVPILREYDVPATVFVPVRAVEDREFAHNSRFDYEYVTEAQLRELADEDLVTVGNHTVTHPRLTEVSDDRVEAEIVGGKQRLEALLGTEVTRFCYPFNDYDERAVAVVRETHDLGVASQGRYRGVTPETDPATVPRINGANPAYEFRWDLSDAAVRVGRASRPVLDRL